MTLTELTVRRRRSPSPRRHGLLVCAPFHSTSNAPVGLAYLRAHLQERGIRTDLLDLNIEARRALRSAVVPGVDDHDRDVLVARLFMQSQRSYLGEALTWAWHDDGGAAAIAKRIEAHPSSLVREFWHGIDIDGLVSDNPLRRVAAALRAWFDERVREVARGPYDWVGFSLTISNVAASLHAARLLRGARPDLLIVLGGPHVSARTAEELLRAAPWVDAAVPAPAYEALEQLLSGLACGAAPPPGVWWRQGGGRADLRPWRDAVIESGPPAGHADMEALPLADWSGLDLALYDPAFDVSAARPGTKVTDRRTVALQTSRGCSYSKCEFCHNVVDYPRYLLQTPGRVVREVQHQVATLGVTNVFFTDDEFNGSRRRMVELGNSLGDNVPDIRFFAWLRLDKIDRPVLEALYRGGCRQVFIGVEAVDDALLGSMTKGYSAAVALDRLRRLAEFAGERSDFRYSFNLIVDHPQEQLGSVIATFEAVCREPELFVGRVAAFCRYHLYEGTPAFARFGSDAIGVLEPLFPQGPPIDSFRYLTPLQDRPDRRERFALWEAIEAITCPHRATTTLSAAGPGPTIYD